MPLTVKTYPVGQLKTNCYLVCDEATKEGLVIDPGDDGEFLSEKILAVGISLKYIIATHGHFDHVLGSLVLQQNFGAKFLLGAGDKQLLKKALQSARFWLKQKNEAILPPAEPDGFLKEGDTISLGKENGEIWELPGHTPGGLGVYFAKSRVFFSGDTLFARGTVGRTDLVGGDKRKLEESVRKILKIRTKTTVCPGHGENFEI